MQLTNNKEKGSVENHNHLHPEGTYDIKKFVKAWGKKFKCSEKACEFSC